MLLNSVFIAKTVDAQRRSTSVVNDGDRHSCTLAVPEVYFYLSCHLGGKEETFLAFWAWLGDDIIYRSLAAWIA